MTNDTRPFEFTLEQMRAKMAEVGIPEYMHEGMIMYIGRGIKPGSFLSAVLRNDLRSACHCADSTNRHLLFEYVFFLYNYAPGGCWGSEEKFEAWNGMQQS